LFGQLGQFAERNILTEKAESIPFGMLSRFIKGFHLLLNGYLPFLGAKE